MKGLICCISFIFIPLSTCLGQNNGFFAGAQFGTFDMISLKNYQDNIRYELKLPLNEINSFPCYFGFEIGYSRSFGNDYQIEIYYNYISTGSRLFYEDYSGKVFFDQVIGGNSVGIHNKLKVGHSEQFTMHLGVRTGVTFTNLTNEFYLKVPGAIPTQNEQYEFRSLNGHISPSFSLRKDLKSFFLKAELRFEFHLRGDLKSKENSNYFLATKSGEPVKAGWDGFRGFIGAGFRF